jgi:dihydrofolate reductase
VLSGDVREAYFDIRSLSETGNIWLVGGGQLASQFLLAGLIDSVEITTAPVLLGAGVKMFASVPVHIQLRQTQSSSYGDFIHSRYDVVRQN